MRILFVTSEFNPRVGGIERYVADLAATLALKTELGLVVGAGQWIHPGQGYVAVGAENLAYPNSPAEFQANMECLRTLARTFRPDAIHLMNAGLTVYAEVISDLAPIFATVHCKDLTCPWQVTPGRDVVSAIAAGLLSCHRIFCASRFTEAQLHARVPGASTAVMTPGLTPSLKADIRSRAVGGERIDTRKHIVTCGQIIRRKGHEQLLRILERMTTPVTWTVIGTGPCDEALQKHAGQSLLREHIRFAGALSDEAMWQMLATADLFALTPIEILDSRGLDAEGFGMVFIEAAAMGVPGIGSIFGGCGDAIDDGVTGLLIDPLNPDAAALEIDRLLSDPDRRTAMAMNALQTTRSKFSWTDRADQLLAAYAASTGRVDP
jgi:glycosyltransferase involved in cell wall biosynthesis